jgi:hypothetical protein
VIREGRAKPEVQKPAGMTPVEQKAALDQLQQLVDRGPDDVFNRTLQKLIDENPKAAAHLPEKVTPYWSSGDRDAVTALRQDFADTQEIIDRDIAAAVSDYERRFEGADPRSGFLLFMFSRLLPTRIPLKGDMIRTILRAPVWQTEEDLQEMGAMLGEPPPAFRQVHEHSQAITAEPRRQSTPAAHWLWATVHWPRATAHQPSTTARDRPRREKETHRARAGGSLVRG